MKPVITLPHLMSAEEMSEILERYERQLVPARAELNCWVQEPLGFGLMPTPLNIEIPPEVRSMKPWLWAAAIGAIALGTTLSLILR
jgi:hypothetical protein